MKTALWWIRRDLRLMDNHALSMALAHGDCTVPVFVLDPRLLNSLHVGPKRVGFLLGGLRQLDDDLRIRGSRLILRRGEPGEELSSLLVECDAEAIFAEEDFTPYARQRDARVAERLPLHLVGGCVVHLPGTVLKADGTPYVVFTAFARKWRTLSLPQMSAMLPAPDVIRTPPDVASLPVPEQPFLPPSVPFPPGEVEAQRRLKLFVDGENPPIVRYAEARDRLDMNGTSRLSPYLHLGMLSPHQAVAAALDAASTATSAEAKNGVQSWLNELIWREFFVHILYHFPDVLQQSFRANLRAIAWENDKVAFAAWCEGATGFPVVDAGMRQLVQTGWMHNRARMITASFLVKDLLVDWRWGERYFAQHLVDGDRAANNGGWQWVAGTGTDATPYFRIFNPVLQGKKHGSQGAYIRRWVPELAHVPDRFIHEPWKMPSEVQQKVSCIVGQDYPLPIVDHRWARERALAAYAKARSTA